MPHRHTCQLQHHRRSRAGGRYFVTLCTARRRPGLVSSLTELIALAGHMDEAGDVLTHAFVVMPDHCHWVFQLGDRLALGQVVAKFKSLSTPWLRSRDLAWQRNYHEHELRADEALEDFCLYVFLNPYRAGLVASDQRWTGWWTGAPQSLRFLTLLERSGTPPAEWLDLPAPGHCADRNEDRPRSAPTIPSRIRQASPPDR